MNGQRIAPSLALFALACLLLSAETTGTLPTTYPTPSIARVTELCARGDEVLDRWSFVSPYLLCYSYDTRAEGVLLFKESGVAPQGSFEHIRDELDYSALTADDLTYRLGVPTNTAQGLVAGLQSSHPTPAVYPAPSVAAVTALCARDEVLDRWSFVSPYLLCYSYDTHAEGVRLFRGVGPGPTASFKLVRDTLGSKVFEAAYLTKFLGVPSKTADALVVGLHSSIQINPIVYPTPSIATIKHVCTHHDMVLGRWSFVSPYLLCYNYDEYTEGVGLYKESGPATNGSFRHIFGTGGEMNADFLIEAGVPSNTARALVSGLHS